MNDILEKVLRGWYSYISFVERNRFTVVFDEDTAVCSTNIRIKGNFLYLEKDEQLKKFFDKLMTKYAVSNIKELREELETENSIISVTWPQIWNVRKYSSSVAAKVAFPLFLIDITESLLNQYIDENIKQIKINLLNESISPVTEQLLYLLGLDLEEVEKKTLFTESAFDFLSSLLIPKEDFSLEESIQLLINTWSEILKKKGLEFKPRPYLFEVEQIEYSGLRKELYTLYIAAKEREILIDQNSAAGLYLSLSAKVEPKKKFSYGLCQGLSPDPEQIDILNSYDSVPLFTIFGPPGTGKTFIVREVLAQQLIKKSFGLIKGEEPSGLFLVSSIVKRATDNVVDFFRTQNKKLKLVLDISNDKNLLNRIFEEQIENLRNDHYDEKFYEQEKKKLIDNYKKINDYLKRIEKEVPEKEREKKKLESLYNDIERKCYETRKKLQKIHQLLKPFHNEKHFLQYYLYIQSLYYRVQSVRSSFLYYTLKPIAKWYESKLLAEARDELAKIAIPLELSDISTYQALEEAFTKLRAIEKELLGRKELEMSYDKQKEELEILKEKIINLEESIEKLKEIEEEKKIKEAFSEEKFIRWHKGLFDSALNILWQNALFHKTRIIEFLSLFRDALVGIKNPDTRESREAIYLFEKSARETLYWTSFVFPILCANLKTFSNDFPFMLTELFDYSIIDEAGYIEPHYAFPVLYRSKKCIISGDPKQLKPLKNLTMAQIDEYHSIYFPDQKLQENYSPAEITALERAAKAYQGEFIGKLKHCRRSHPKIVKLFSQIGGYNLIADTKESARIRELVEEHFSDRIYYVNVEAPNKGNWTENVKEVIKIKSLVRTLLAMGFDSSDIAVITPYVKQERRLLKTLKNYLDKENIGTVHKFQGREANIVIFSPVIWNPDHRKIFFSANSNLLNTAVSRAKSLLFVVGCFNILLEAPRWIKIFAESVMDLGSEYKMIGDEEEGIEEIDLEEEKEEIKKLSDNALKIRKKKRITNKSRILENIKKKKQLLKEKNREG